MASVTPAPASASPTTQPTLGRCHLCQDRFAEVTYCGLCDHWFCEACRRRWFWRGLAFVKQLTGGRQEGCCGPREVAHA